MIAILLIIIGLGGLIFVHELGHFLVAKWAGVKVEVFSIGFGWKFLKTTYGETEYALSAIPLGGYVKMAGELPNEDRTGADYELHSKPPWKRFWIFSAGSLMNLMVAFPLCIMMYWIGVDVPVNRIGQVRPASPEWEAGLEPGEQLVGLHVEQTGSSSGEKGTWGARIDITSLGDYREQLIRLKDQQKLKLIIRSGSDSSSERTVVLNPEDPLASGEGGEGGQNLFPPSNIVQQVTSRSPAQYAGLQKGDQIWSINGYPIHSIQDIRTAVNHVVNPELDYLIETEEGKRVIRTLSVPQGASYLIRTDDGTVPLNRLSENLTLKQDLPLAESEQILRVDGHPVDQPPSSTPVSNLSSARVIRAPASPLRVQVRRTTRTDSGSKRSVTKRLSVYPAVKNEMDYELNYLMRPVLKSVKKGSPAERAGLSGGDRIQSINGNSIEHYAEFLRWIRSNPGRELTVTVQNGPSSSEDSASETIQLVPEKNPLGEGQIGVIVNRDQPPTPLADLPKDTGWMRSGFRAGDRVRAFYRSDGERVPLESSLKPLRTYAYGERPERIKLDVTPSDANDGKTVSRTYEPVKRRSGFIGISTAPETYQKKHNFTSGIKNGIQRAAGMYALTVIGIKRMFSSTENARNNLAGPVRIFSISHSAAERDLGQFLLILAMITISLGLLNLLPLPPLDGGHILFLLIEKLKGEPLGEDTLYLIQMLGFLFLLLFIILVTYNDILHLVAG